MRRKPTTTTEIIVLSITAIAMYLLLVCKPIIGMPKNAEDRPKYICHKCGEVKFYCESKPVRVDVGNLSYQNETALVCKECYDKSRKGNAGK